MKNASRPNRTTPAVRISFPDVFRPRAFQEGDTPRYSVTMMFNKANAEHMAFVKLLHGDLQAALAAKWPDPSNRPRTPLVGSPRSPIKDGDTTLNLQDVPIKENNPAYAGHYIVRASSTKPIKVVDRRTSEIIDDSEVYGGCWAKVAINAYTYSGRSQGVTLGLNGLQKWADDDSFGGGRPSVEQMFTAEDGGADDPSNYGDNPFVDNPRAAQQTPAAPDPFAGTSAL